MKTSMIIILMILFSQLYADEEPFDPKAELFIGNFTETILYTKFYPIGSLFNGDSHSYTNPTRYSLSINSSFVRRRGDTSKLFYIMGIDGYALNNQNNQGYFKLNIFNGIPSEWNNWLLLSHDATAHINDWHDGIFGYGKYI